MYTSTQAIDHKYLWTCTQRQTDGGKGPGLTRQGHIKTESQKMSFYCYRADYIIIHFGEICSLQLGTFGAESQTLGGSASAMF